MVKKKLLIVGGTGFLGRHILIKSIQLGFKSTSISLNQIDKKKKLQGVKYLKIDIREKKQLDKLKEKFDYVINASGYGGFYKNSNISKSLDTQFEGLKNLASKFLNKKIKKFIQIGSSLEYGVNKSPNNEKMIPKKPLTNYGESKLNSTNYLLLLNKFFNFPAIIFRLYQVYGPSQGNNRLVGYIVNSIKNNKHIYVTKGNQVRDFLYVSDFVDAIFLALKNKRLEGEVINIGFGKGYKVKDIINKIIKLFPNKKIKIFKTKKSKKEQKKLYPKIQKARILLNWKPQVSLEDGLTKILFKSNG